VEIKPKKETKKEGLPYWCAYIAYAVAFITCAVATTFVFFYGMTFGAPKSAKWLMSMTISLVQDVLISQPIKIFILASIFALLIKDPNKAESEPITDANKLGQDEEWVHKNVKVITSRHISTTFVYSRLQKPVKHTLAYYTLLSTIVCDIFFVNIYK